MDIETTPPYALVWVASATSENAPSLTRKNGGADHSSSGHGPHDGDKEEGHGKPDTDAPVPDVHPVPAPSPPYDPIDIPDPTPSIEPREPWPRS